MAYIGKSPTAAPLTSSDVADGIITNAKLAQDIISGDTALGATPADTDEFLVSDAGTLKRVDYSYIKGGGITQADMYRITTDFNSLNSCELVIEAATENFGIKTNIFSTLDEICNKYKASFKNTCFVGDDYFDLPMLNDNFLVFYKKLTLYFYDFSIVR